MRWGAAAREASAAMPGDEVVARAQFIATRAITIDARPEDVWPWIMQLGYGRGGFYTYDLIDNGGRPSADRIIGKYRDRAAITQREDKVRASRLQAADPARGRGDCAVSLVAVAASVSS